jgi:hypothetical protein
LEENRHFTSFHSTQPNFEKNSFLPPKKQLFEKKKKKKPQPFILRNPFEEIKKIINQPSLSLGSKFKPEYMKCFKGREPR